MISSKTLPENDDSQAFDSILIILFIMDFNKNFKVRVPKCPFDEKHQKTR